MICISETNTDRNTTNTDNNVRKNKKRVLMKTFIKS